VLLAEVVADELVPSERASALGLDVDVGEVDAEGEEARAEGEEGGRGEELPGSGRGAPPHPSAGGVAALWNCGEKGLSVHISPRVEHHSPTARPPRAGARRDGSSAASDRGSAGSGLIFVPRSTDFEFRDPKFIRFDFMFRFLPVDIQWRSK